jgi:hypothetical protein
VAGERFETFASGPDQLPHVVVRLPTFDVHVAGDALSSASALDLARALIEVAAPA